MSAVVPWAWQQLPSVYIFTAAETLSINNVNFFTTEFANRNAFPDTRMNSGRTSVLQPITKQVSGEDSESTFSTASHMQLPNKHSLYSCVHMCAHASVDIKYFITGHAGNSTSHSGGGYCHWSKSL